MKKKLRSQLLLERLNHNPEEKSKKDNHIIENISSHNLFKKAKTVLFYLPIQTNLWHFRAMLRNDIRQKQRNPNW